MFTWCICLRFTVDDRSWARWRGRNFPLIWFVVKNSSQNCWIHDTLCDDVKPLIWHLNQTAVSRCLHGKSKTIICGQFTFDSCNLSIHLRPQLTANPNWIEFVISDNKLHSLSTPLATMNGDAVHYKYHANNAQCKYSWTSSRNLNAFVKLNW